MSVAARRQIAPLRGVEFGDWLVFHESVVVDWSSTASIRHYQFQLVTSDASLRDVKPLSLRAIGFHIHVST